MNDLRLPESAEELTKHLKSLHEDRRKVQKERKKNEPERSRQRRQLTNDERTEVLKKTASHCHLCGGNMNENSDGELPKERVLDVEFVVDHIVPYASGGEDSLDNFLAAHGLCNGCRWFYSPEEFQWILRMGIWTRKQMEDGKTEIDRK